MIVLGADTHKRSHTPADRSVSNRARLGGIRAGGMIMGEQLRETSAPPGGSARLSLAFASLAEVEFRMGDLQGAYASAIESLRLAHATGGPEETMHGLSLVALVEAGLGHEEACRRHGEQALAMASRHGEDSCAVLARGALGLLEVGLGHLDAAIARLGPLTTARATRSETGRPGD